jgi:hypothetical protein
MALRPADEVHRPAVSLMSSPATVFGVRRVGLSM